MSCPPLCGVIILLLSTEPITHTGNLLQEVRTEITRRHVYI